MLKRTVVLVACLAALSACSSGDADDANVDRDPAPRLSLETVCQRLADQGEEEPTNQADYAVLLQRTSAVAASADSEAAEVVAPLEAAYTQAAESEDVDALLVARQDIRDAFAILQSECEAAGSPLS